MIIKIKEKYKISEPNLLFGVLGNDYIVYSPQKIYQLESLKTTEFFLMGMPYDNKTLFIPILTHVEEFYSSQGFTYIELNGYDIVLISLNLSALTAQDSSRILQEMLKDTTMSRLLVLISGLFLHMERFISYQIIHEYKAVYDKIIRHMEHISNEIVDYVRNNYPDAQPHEDLSRDINICLRRHLPGSSMDIKIMDNFHDLLKSPIIIILRRIEIKLKSLIAIKQYNEDEHYSKTTKNFIINASISSFIKALPIKLWQLCNQDALSILVEPNVWYTVVHKDQHDDFISSMTESEDNKKISLFIEPHYYLILVVGYTLLNRVTPIRISLNISGLSFLLKSNSVKNFTIVLNEVINNVMIGTIKKFSHIGLVCSRLAV